MSDKTPKPLNMGSMMDDHIEAIIDASCAETLARRLIPTWAKREMKAIIFLEEDCRTLYAQGEPYGNDHPNGWQDMADRLNRIASERIAEYIGSIGRVTILDKE